MGVTAEQTRFLSERIKCNSDTAAAKLAGVKPDTVYHWKLDQPEFKALYDGLASDGVKLCMEILRQSLGRTAEVVVEAMEAKDGRGKPDHIARMNAARLNLQAHGLLKERRILEGDADNPVQVTHKPDLSQLSIEELAKLAELHRRARTSGNRDVASGDDGS